MTCFFFLFFFFGGDGLWENGGKQRQTFLELGFKYPFAENYPNAKYYIFKKCGYIRDIFGKKNTLVSKASLYKV